MTPSSQTPFTSSTICLTDAPAGGAFNNLRHDLERGRERDGGSTDRCTDRNEDDDDDDVGWREGWSWGTWKQTGRDWGVKACQKYKLKPDTLAETASFSLHRPLVDTQVWERALDLTRLPRRSSPVLFPLRHKERNMCDPRTHTTSAYTTGLNPVLFIVSASHPLREEAG